MIGMGSIGRYEQGWQRTLIMHSSRPWSRARALDSTTALVQVQGPGLDHGPGPGPGPWTRSRPWSRASWTNTQKQLDKYTKTVGEIHKNKCRNTQNQTHTLGN